MLKIIILIFVILLIIKTYTEKFDGYGKSFGYYYHPRPACLKSENCFPGSYVKHIPYINDSYKFKCCLNNHLNRKCVWTK